MSYPVDREFADKFLPQIATILKDNAKHIVDVVVAPHEDDTLRATDFKIKVESGDVAGRLRRWSKYTINKEWTVRSRRDSGMETELSKLKKGYARWYLYGWIQDDIIFSWMLIDLDAVRKKNLLNLPWREKDNHDGTHFIIVPNTELKKHGCVVSYYHIDSLSRIDELKHNTNEVWMRFQNKDPHAEVGV